MSAARRAPADAGFTLIELIVCLGLLSLIAALAATGLAVARRSATLIDAADGADATRAVEMHLKRGFERAQPVFVADAAGTARLVFAGASDQLRFIARSDGRLEMGGLVQVELALQGEGDDRALVTRRVPLGAAVSGEASAPAGGESKPHVLLSGVRTLRIRYFGAAQLGGAPAWSDSWQNHEVMPELIAVDLGFVNTRRHWTEAVFNVPASSSGM